MPRKTNNTPTSLRQARKARRLTQAHLAALLGVDTTHLCRIELGTRSPSDDLAQRIADHFGVPADHFPWPQRDARLDAAIQRLVADFPALTRGQREQISAVLTQTERAAS